MLRLYDYWESGNCYKVRLLLSQLGIAFERVHLDMLKGETRTPGFVAKHPNHRVPLLEWLKRLPAPQRDALATTFGLREGQVPDRFFVFDDEDASGRHSLVP